MKSAYKNVLHIQALPTDIKPSMRKVKRIEFEEGAGKSSDSPLALSTPSPLPTTPSSSPLQQFRSISPFPAPDKTAAESNPKEAGVFPSPSIDPFQSELHSLRSGPGALDLLAVLDFLEILQSRLPRPHRAPEVQRLYDLARPSPSPDLPPLLHFLSAASLERALVEDRGDEPSSVLFLLHQVLLRALTTPKASATRSALLCPQLWQGVLFRMMHERGLAALVPRAPPSAPLAPAASLYAALPSRHRALILRHICDEVLLSLGPDPSLHWPLPPEDEAQPKGPGRPRKAPQTQGEGGELGGVGSREAFEEEVSAEMASRLEPLGWAEGEKGGQRSAYLLASHPTLLSLRLVRMRAVEGGEEGEMGCEVLAASVEDYRPFIDICPPSQPSDGASAPSSPPGVILHPLPAPSADSPSLGLGSLLGADPPACPPPCPLRTLLRDRHVAQELEALSEEERIRLKARLSTFRDPPKAPAGPSNQVQRLPPPSTIDRSRDPRARTGVGNVAIGRGAGGSVWAGAPLNGTGPRVAGPRGASGVPPLRSGRALGASMKARKEQGRRRQTRNQSGRSKAPNYCEISEESGSDSDAPGNQPEEADFAAATPSLLLDPAHPPTALLARNRSNGKVLTKFQGLPFHRCALLDPLAPLEEEEEKRQGGPAGKDGNDAVEFLPPEVREARAAALQDRVDQLQLQYREEERQGAAVLTEAVSDSNPLRALADSVSQLELLKDPPTNSPRPYFCSVRGQGRSPTALLVDFLLCAGEGPWAPNKGASRRLLGKGGDSAEVMIEVSRRELTVLLQRVVASCNT